MLRVRPVAPLKFFVLAAAVSAVRGGVCMGDAPVEGDETLLKTLIDVQATNLTLYPKGELTAEVSERVSGLEATATVVWDGNRTYWKYRLKQVVDVPIKGKPGKTEAQDSIQEGEMIEIPGELMMYFPSFFQARRYVQHESGEGYARELKLRPEQTWYKARGTVDLNELISPTSFRAKGVEKFVVKGEPGDQVVIERRVEGGAYLRFVASLAAGGNITGFEVLQPTKQGRYGKGDYSWAQDPAGRWCLRELRFQEAAAGRPDEIQRDLRIKFTHFDAEPRIRNDRFQFSSFQLADGTVVEEGLILGRRPALRTYRVGGKGQTKTHLSESELNSLADRLREKGFAAPDRPLN